MSPRSKDSKSERHYKTLQLISEKNRNLKNQLQTAIAQVTHVASLNRENAEESQVHGERAAQLQHELGITMMIAKNAEIEKSEAVMEAKHRATFADREAEEKRQMVTEYQQMAVMNESFE